MEPPEVGVHGGHGFRVFLRGGGVLGGHNRSVESLMLNKGFSLSGLAFDNG